MLQRMNIAALFIRRPVATALIMLGMLFFGAASYVRLTQIPSALHGQGQSDDAQRHEDHGQHHPNRGRVHLPVPDHAQPGHAQADEQVAQDVQTAGNKNAGHKQKRKQPKQENAEQQVKIQRLALLRGMAALLGAAGQGNAALHRDILGRSRHGTGLGSGALLHHGRIYRGVIHASLIQKGHARLHIAHVRHRIHRLQGRLGRIAHRPRNGGLHIGRGRRLGRHKALRANAEAATLQRVDRIAQRRKISAALLGHHWGSRHPRIRPRNGSRCHAAHGIAARKWLLIRRGHIGNAPRLHGIDRLYRRCGLLHRRGKKIGGWRGGRLLGRPGKIGTHNALWLKQGLFAQRRALLHPVGGRG